MRYTPSYIIYSDKYYDERFEYRHVIISKDAEDHIPKGKLLSEFEWRDIGVQMSPGWEHYLIYEPEPNVIFFRREREDCRQMYQYQDP